MSALLQASLLAAIAGYVDAVGFLRFDAFAGMITGNTVLLGIALAGKEPSRALYYAAIVLAFLVGVLLSRALLRAGLRPLLAGLFAAAVIGACAFIVSPWAAPLLAVAMGTQNAAATRFGGVALNTVFLTGNLQKLGEGLITRLWPAPDRPSPGDLPPGGILILVGVWLSYATGAALAALAYESMSRPLLPAAVLLPLVLLRSPRR
jgi:uncharacterized membrane protein YoaK (UPF0700 family)